MIAKNGLAAAGLAALLAGCAGISQVVREEIPVPVPCNPPEVAKPAMPVDSLGAGADEFEFARALWATVEEMMGYERQLEAAIDACRK